MSALKFSSKRALLLGALMAGCGSLYFGAPAQAADSNVTLDGTRVFPESLGTAPDGTLYVGSLPKGEVQRALPGQTKASVFIPRAPGDTLGVLGVVADQPSNTLWVCYSDISGKTHDTDLRAFDLQSGALKANYPFPGGGLCNDIAITPDGTAYATDTNNGRVMILKKGASSIAEWVKDPRFMGADGIALGSDGSVIITTVTTGHLYRIDMAANGAPGKITDLQLSAPIKGPDGFRPGKDGTYLLAENAAGQVDQVTISGDKATISPLKGGFDVPTAVSLHNNTVYVGEAKFDYMMDPKMKDKDPGTFTVYAVPLPGTM